jgi:tetratricopeptide (TPR) repeat protein
MPPERDEDLLRDIVAAARAARAFVEGPIAPTIMNISSGADDRSGPGKAGDGRAHHAETDRAGSERSRRPSLGEARESPTAELVGVLTPYAGPLDEEDFRRRVRRFPSAEAMTRSLLAGRDVEGWEVERVWLALRVLWERWAPDAPFFERLDDRMQDGYDEGDAVARCDLWLEAWRDVLRLAEKFALTTVEEFDRRFNGTQLLLNWIQDLETELLNAAAQDERFARERIRYGEEFLARFADVDPTIVENMRRAIADSHFQIGEAATGDRLYRQWLEADPSWGWGWIGWSDAYGLFASPAQGAADFARAAEILEQGLAESDVRDRRDLLERLADVHREAGRKGDERRVRRAARRLAKSARAQTSIDPLGEHGVRIRHTIDFGEEGLPLERLPDLRAALAGKARAASSGKIGRNDPCPCGSGKKYKKCCGRSPASAPS